MQGMIKIERRGSVCTPQATAVELAQLGGGVQGNKLFPCGHCKLEQGDWIKNDTASIALLKISYPICKKVAWGRLTAHPGKSRGGTPFCRRNPDRFI